MAENEFTPDEDITGEAPPLEAEEDATEPAEPAEQDQAPVEEPEPAEPEEEAVAEEDEPVVDEPPEPSEDMKAWQEKMAKTLDKIEKRQHYLQRQLEKNRAPQPMPELTESELEAPKQDDFESYDDYQAALIEYKGLQKMNERIRDYNEKVVSESAQTATQDFINTTIEAGSDKYKDFADVVVNDQSLPITNEMIELVAELEVDSPEDVFYYLGKNRKECARISRMSRTQAARALTQVEATVKQAISQAGGDNAKPAKKKVTNAPPPIKPNKGSAVASKDPSKMTQAEYEAWRQGGQA